MSKQGWQQVRSYPDHLGHPVVLEQFIEPDFTPDPSDLLPIQVYSLVSLDEDHQQLRQYLMHSFMHEESKPLFEIYSYCPSDAFACIEHNRREIAYRKQQYRSGVQNLPPLIPQFFRPSDDIPAGFCVLLRSYSYRLGYVEDWDELAEAGEGPDLLYFNRSFPSTYSVVDNMQRLSDFGDPSPYIFELSIERVICQIDIGQIIMNDVFLNAQRPWLQYAMEVDEGEPPDLNPPSEEQIHNQLGHEIAVSGFSLGRAFQISRDADIVTVTNAPEGTSADIQYLVYALFLSHIRDTAGPSLLERTAWFFTAAIVSHLPVSTTLTLKFAIPGSLSSIRQTQTEILSHQTEGRAPGVSFTIGALHIFSAGDGQPPLAHRVTPQQPKDTLIAVQRTLCTPFRVFAVVLDRVRFISEAGVYFYMADWDSSGDLDPDLEVCPDDAQVWRGGAIGEIARRLGMVVLDGLSS
ncbi:conserved hypothetical protein [Aspergillus terreus NIH2624]|uniref:Uncharacterized protein n=1 Tax=Aspergillus terreus (strain NIH 2624 / FGSC A1156) TaxID=341663 RepID=Q0CJ73_ASPTN|nr:uncharacterized protein ATEG_06261 [Aspergillus terreus NIH2624]EAU32805.1 conserved hypothetical protein [Aspergillus terreus NIH2624]